jgi:O-glycosyl hydrolase
MATFVSFLQIFFYYQVSSSSNAAEQVQVNWVATTDDMQYALKEMPSITFSASTELDPSKAIIDVDHSQTYQKIYGIGASLESSTAYNMMRANEKDMELLLKRLFDRIEGIGFNLMRITIGTSDFCPLPFYSYDDLAENETDVNLEKFSISRDEEFILPALLASKEASDVSSNSPADRLLFFASPWSAPAWMKEPQKLEGGVIQSKYLSIYASYLVKFVDEYAKRGIKISAITPQNEPLTQQSYPSTFLPPDEEATLIKEYLGPYMRERDCEIWCFDHNWNTPWYPESILNDTDAAVFVSGSAWHGYRGHPTAMTEVHNQFPDKDIFFTETSTFGSRGAVKIVDIFRNWARSYNAWVVMLDSNLQPNSGPFKPSPTMVILNATTLEIEYNTEYFIYGQFSKFIRRGAIRIGSETFNSTSHFSSMETTSDSYSDLAHVAFVNDPAVSGLDNYVLVIVNKAKKPTTVQLRWMSMVAAVNIPASSTNTFTWSLN